MKKKTRRRSESAPELVIKMNVSVDSTGDNALAYPDLLFFANAAGWKLLAELFEARARKDHSKYPVNEWDADLEDHDHLERKFNPALSDRIGIRLGTITPANRRLLFERWKIDSEKVYGGSLTQWFPAIVKSAKIAEQESKRYCATPAKPISRSKRRSRKKK